MDITSDGLGFMLTSAVPIEAFIHSLQDRYLVFRQLELGPFYTVQLRWLLYLPICEWREERLP